MSGKFISFEGGEGTGKSTHAATLARRLESLGLHVLLTRAPGGSPGAEIIRHLLLSGAAKPFGPEAEAMMFAVAQDDHIRNIILPALAAGTWVVCDGFADSIHVYQKAVGKIDERFIKALERKFSLSDLYPDLTFVLDVPVVMGLERAARRRGDSNHDWLKTEKLDFHETRREAYLRRAAAEPERFVIIEASPTEELVAKRVWNTVNVRLEPALAPVKF